MDDLGEVPTYIKFISNGQQAKNTVKQLLCLDKPLCLPIVFKRAGIIESRLSLLGLYMNSKFYIFDVRDVSSVVVASGLLRLFVSPSVVKVTHGGSRDFEELAKNRIIVQSLFDTHKAFDRVAHWNGMPARKISIPALHRKLNGITSELDIEQAELDAVLRCPVFTDETGLDWGKRPVSCAMLVQLAAEVAALHQCYFGLRCVGRRFNDYSTLLRTERIGEGREAAVMAVGSLAAAASGKDEEEQEGNTSRKVALCQGIQNNLLSMGQSVLDETWTVASYRLIPFYHQNN